MESLEGSGKFTIFAVSNRWTVVYPLPLSNFCVLLDCLTGAKIPTIFGTTKKNGYILTMFSKLSKVIGLFLHKFAKHGKI